MEEVMPGPFQAPALRPAKSRELIEASAAERRAAVLWRTSLLSAKSSVASGAMFKAPTRRLAPTPGARLRREVWLRVSDRSSQGALKVRAALPLAVMSRLEAPKPPVVASGTLPPWAMRL